MVEGPITGTEVDFPNNPVADQEFQSPVRFVYKWTDENRWKNIHRPLVIADYIWETPDGTDDWVRDVLTLPINGGSFRTAGNITSKTEPRFDAYSGQVNALYVAADYGESEYDYPYEWVQGRAEFMSGRFTHQPLNIDNTFWYQGVFILDIASSSKCRVVIPVEDLGDPSRLDEVTFKLTVSCKHVEQGGLYGVPFQNEFSIYAMDITQTGFNVTGGVQYDFGTMNKGERIENKSVEIMFPSSNIPNQTWVVFELSQDASFYYYDVVIEVQDPYGPGDSDFYPVGFSSNTPIDRSLFTFEGTPGLGVPSDPIMGSIRHNEPGGIGDSSIEQTINLTGIKDITTGATGTVPYKAIHYRDAGEAFIGLRGDTNVLEYRHLRVPYDISTTGDIVFDAEMDYDFRDFCTESPALTGEVKGLYVDPSGYYVFILLDTNINRYELSSPWDLSTLDPLTFNTMDVSAFAPAMFTMTFDGRVIVIGKAGLLKQIILDTPWSLIGAIDTGFEREFDINDPVGITVSPDSRTMLILDKPLDLADGYQVISYTRT